MMITVLKDQGFDLSKNQKYYVTRPGNPQQRTADC